MLCTGVSGIDEVGGWIRVRVGGVATRKRSFVFFFFASLDFFFGGLAVR